MEILIVLKSEHALLFYTMILYYNLIKLSTVLCKLISKVFCHSIVSSVIVIFEASILNSSCIIF